MHIIEENRYHLEPQPLGRFSQRYHWKCHPQRNLAIPLDCLWALRHSDSAQHHVYTILLAIYCYFAVCPLDHPSDVGQQQKDGKNDSWVLDQYIFKLRSYGSYFVVFVHDRPSRSWAEQLGCAEPRLFRQPLHSSLQLIIYKSKNTISSHCSLYTYQQWLSRIKKHSPNVE